MEDLLKEWRNEGALWVFHKAKLSFMSLHPSTSFM